MANLFLLNARMLPLCLYPIKAITQVGLLSTALDFVASLSICRKNVSLILGYVLALLYKVERVTNLTSNLSINFRVDKIYMCLLKEHHPDYLKGI